MNKRDEGWPVMGLATLGVLLAVLAGTLLPDAQASAANGIRRIDRPTYQSRSVRIPHSRTIACDVDTRNWWCYNTRGDNDLCSRPYRWGLWHFAKPIQYSISAHTRVEGSRVVMHVTWRSQEEGGDHSRFYSYRKHTLYTAPSGYRISSVDGPGGWARWFKYGAHAGHTMIAPSWFARDLGCDHVLIKGDSPGSDVRQGYRMLFQMKVDLKPTS